MRALYLDVTCGIAGDMFLAALLDAGCDRSALETLLKGLPIGQEFDLHASRVRRGALMGTHLDVKVHNHGSGQTVGSVGRHGASEHDHGAPGHEHEASAHKHETSAHKHEASEHDHEVEQQGAGEEQAGAGHGHSHGAHGRSYAEIVRMIQESQMPAPVQEDAIAVFTRLGQVEARLHGTSIEEIHFHEVGAVDSIVDIVGCCAALHLLGVEEVYSSPVVDGHGTLHCAHGVMPVPAPATLELLQGVPLLSCEIPHELVTPTGAALLTHFARSYGPRPGMVVRAIGYGAGTRDFPQRPNLLRVTLGDLV